MKIVYDENKRLSNIRKHGFDFADVTLDFFEFSTIVPVKSGRFMAIGAIGNGILAVVFVILGTEGLSIISMRRASKKERVVHGYT